MKTRLLISFLLIVFTCTITSAGSCDSYAKTKAGKTNKAKSQAKKLKQAKAQRTLKPRHVRIKEFYFAHINQGIPEKPTKILVGHRWGESNLYEKGIARKIYNEGSYNAANVTCPPDASGIWLYEWENGKLAKKKWRAWKSMEEEAIGFHEFLKRRYPKALAAAYRGDVIAYADALTKAGYHTGSKKKYRQLLAGSIKYVNKMIES